MTRDEERAWESVARAEKIGLRAMQVAVGSLGVVILVMALSLVVALGLARQARTDATTLNDELQCRSRIAAEFDVAVGETVVMFGQAQSGEVSPEEFEATLDNLRNLAERRANSVEICAEKREGG